jgi:uroporphyrin-III C-methyltransferase/precorrin-2 dehydrogenase/sirohydrochlorin ferrochelatase
VAADARARGTPVNVVDAPALCTFIMPAIIDRSPVLVSISTAGASPSLARLTRARVEAVLPPRLGELARFAARHRSAVQRALPDVPARRQFWDAALAGAIAEHVLAGREAAADAELRRALADTRARTASVTLIAVGDGKPDWLPLRALQALSSADLVLHEAGVPGSVLELGRRDAAQVGIGPRGASGWPAAKLAETVVEAVAAGRPVCVLWLGDPFGVGTPPEQALIEQHGVGVICLRPAPAAPG